jgi:DNA-directed RNA polymerase II subunit RPB2
MGEKQSVDKWDIIDTFFRDTEYYKSQHHIDSFNEFIYSNDNGIKQIITRENPFIIFKGETKQRSDFQYEIQIFYGETLLDSGDIDTSIEENVFVSSPAIYDDSLQAMFPNDARLKNLTYQSSIFCNIGIKYILHNEEDRIVVRNFKKVNIGSIPVMVHSKLCLLHKLDPIRLSEFGECPYDHGGYFIIKGKEKIILSQEKKVNNVFYINKNSDENIILQGNIKSISNEGLQSSRTNLISIIKKNLIVKSNEIPLRRSENIIVVRILGIDISVPLFILFRALGYESDKEILPLIIYDSDNQELKDKLFQLLSPSIKDSQPVFSQSSAFKLLSLNTKGKEVFNVLDILNNNLFPNYGTNMHQKSHYLGYATRKLLLTHIGMNKETDRDSYSYKRIDLSGTLLLELYRELWGNFKRQTSRKMDDEYKINFESIADKEITSIINEQNISKVFNNSVMNTIGKSFGARFGTGISARQGIVQDLNRNVMLGTLSHTRRLSYPLPAGSKSIGPRKLHNSQYGFVCPTESPDGSNVGIINHLSILARVTTNIDEGSIEKALLLTDMKLLENVTTKDFHNSTKVFLNGRLIGIHYEPKQLYTHLRLLKLNSFINILTSISWNIHENELHIFSDSGRIMRPVFYLKTNSKGKYNELIDGKYEYIQSWKHAIHGYLLRDTIDFETASFFEEEFNGFKTKCQTDGADLYEELEKNASPIEYIDSIETENFLIARDSNTFQSNHTHCEIHPSLILSSVALNIPFPEHSQYPRNAFSCQQTKQAVGVYSSAFTTRFETFSHILHYPQRPIVTTRYKKYTDVDKLPYGINAIVAIASYGGYNQEDGILLNKTSIERGMFQSLYLRSYEDEDDENEYFGNPMLEKNIQKTDTSKYDNLDDNGFIKENTYVTHDDIIMAKCSKKYTQKGQEITKVRGTSIKFGTSGIVDKIVVSKKQDGGRMAKVRIRKIKIPGIGDKFASRCGQKGMCGMVIPSWEMPHTQDGIVPDIIINPHAIPSRMTINQLLEVVLGKSSCLGGFLGDATPFQNNDIREFTKVLEGFNYEKNGNEVMYSGITGEQIKTSIFIGPTYYQRLKIMVADKMHSRGTGPLQHLVRQPQSGRANNGGLRIGEMERDSIIGHGIAGFLRECMMERSDAFKVQVDTNSGLISYDGNSHSKKMVSMPYCMKLLLQELQSISIAPRIITEKIISNKPVFNYIVQNLSSDTTPINQLDDDELETFFETDP